MRTDLLDRIRKSLCADYKFKTSGEWLQKGVCPKCGQKELFAHADQPWVIKCGRYNKCGYEGHVKDIYAELFTKFNERYKPTRENPNATADAYLQYARGFDLKPIKGWYRQEKYWHPHGDKGTATVRFDIDRARDIYMERLIEPVTVSDASGKKTVRKANFHGKHKGLWWQPPGTSFKDGDTVWLVEGCFDAIALNLSGVKSAAVLSAVNYPEIMLEAHKDRKINWVFALDNDPAGKRYTKRHVTKARAAELKVGAAQIPSSYGKMDWNDLYQLGRLNEDVLSECLYKGDLLIAGSAFEKAMIMWRQTRSSAFGLTFNNRQYWFKTEIEKLNKAVEELTAAYPDLNPDQIRSKAIKQASMLREICNCDPRFLYFQSHDATDESWYFCNISFPSSRPAIKTTFTGAQIASATEFKKRLLTAVPGGLYTGGANELNWFVKNNLSRIKQVKTIDFVGFSKNHNAYIFNDFAVSKGVFFKANDEEYIEFDNISIKTLSRSFKFEIGQSHQYNSHWSDCLYRAFGVKGLVALTFWFGSLFAEQIRTAHKSYPFLEIVGEPGSGKTTLIEFLWKLFGLEDTEGFDPSKSTFASIRRKFAQVSNLPIVLLEGDREDASKYKKFDFNQLKDSYNGRAFGERGIKNAGNETYAPAFKAAIVISQNSDVQGSDAVLQRIVHLNFDTESHTMHTRAASDELNQLSVENVSYFLLKCIQQENPILKYFTANTRRYENRLLEHDRINNIRIAKNHAQMMALADCLVKVTDLQDGHRREIHSYIEALAVERERAVKADHPLLQDFWEAFDYLNGDPDYGTLNHARDPNLLAINLNHFVKMAAEQKQQIPALTELKPLLKQTRTHKFLGIRAVNSRLADTSGFTARTVKCWVFEKKGSS